MNICESQNQIDITIREIDDYRALLICLEDKKYNVCIF